jgi:hypothetical protein
MCVPSAYEADMVTMFGGVNLGLCVSSNHRMGGHCPLRPTTQIWPKVSQHVDDILGLDSRRYRDS